MVLYRRKKKESVAVMTQEQDRLENELKAKVAAIEVAPETSGDTPARPIEVAFQRLRTESTLLVRQNMVLQEHVHLHRGFRGYIQRNCDEFLRELSGTDTVSSSPKQQVRSSRTIQPLICNSPWVALSRQQADGFRVLFSSGEPSFYLPGDMHTRFFQLVTRQVTVNEAQNRSVRFVVPVVAADSSDNARSRAAEDPVSAGLWREATRSSSRK